MFVISCVVKKDDEPRIKNIKKNTVEEAKEVAKELSIKYGKAIITSDNYDALFKNGVVTHEEEKQEKEISEPTIDKDSIQAEIVINNLTFQWLQFRNNREIKQLGGLFANRCVEKNIIKYYKSAYLRDRAFSKFVINCMEERK